MSDNDELKMILGGMIAIAFPDRTKDIIKSLSIIVESVREIMKNHNLNDNEEDILSVVSASLCYFALHGKIDNI